jgi:1-acyl-sn-glycerol-3-phosphate acyltransferase
MRVDGAYELREEHSLFNRPGRVRVYIGKPVEFPRGSDPKEIARVIEQCVAELGQDREKKQIAKAHAAGE